MSYSRTYNGSVYYSGSVSVSYPASEHGGTTSASYSGSVPVSVNLYVDTSPFDSSVRSCSASVNTLNGAVVAMNASQVASINQASENISSHVISGFFNMIKSELSQNMTALLAKFKAVFELLTQNSARVEKQQLVMQDDYSRISGRYTKIFSDLDEELEKRVAALDKNVFEISKKIQGEQLNNETAKKVAQFVLGTNEDDILQQELLVANTKSKVLGAMQKMSENVVQQAVYSNQVKNILEDSNVKNPKENFVPVIFTESADLDSSENNSSYSCFANSISDSSVLQIENSVKNFFLSNPDKSEDLTEDEKSKVDDAFKLIAENEFLDKTDEKSKRVYEMIKTLAGDEK